MKDIAGIKLEENMVVAFNPPTYKGLTLGRVVGFTPKKVKLEYRDWQGRMEYAYAYPDDVAQVNSNPNGF